MIMIFLVHLCKIKVSSVFYVFFFFFIFSKFRFSRLFERFKGQKMAQSDRKLCSSHSESQEPYVMWLWFLVVFFSFFSKFWFFWDFRGGAGGGEGSLLNYQLQSVRLYISETVDISSRFLVYRYKIMMISPGVFLKNTTL